MYCSVVLKIICKQSSKLQKVRHRYWGTAVACCGVCGVLKKAKMKDRGFDPQPGQKKVGHTGPFSLSQKGVWKTRMTRVDDRNPIVFRADIFLAGRLGSKLKKDVAGAELDQFLRVIRNCKRNQSEYLIFNNILRTALPLAT
jgi:hypothetical protein